MVLRSLTEEENLESSGRLRRIYSRNQDECDDRFHRNDSGPKCPLKVARDELQPNRDKSVQLVWPKLAAP